MRTTNGVLKAILSFVSILTIHGIATSQVPPSQVDPNNATGIMPYNTYGGVRENISFATGNLNLHLPLLMLPGRKGHDLSLGLVYDSKVWNIHYQSDEFGTSAWWDSDQIGWRLDWPVLTGTSVSVFINPNLGSVECQGHFMVQLQDGSKHPFFGGPLGNGARTNCWHTYPDHHSARETSFDILQYDTGDASYLTIDVSNTADIVVYQKDGTQLHFGSIGYWMAANKIQDADGNQITVSGGQITDTVGRTMPLPLLPTTTAISYTDSGGTSRTITLNYNTVTLHTAFVLPSEAGSGPQVNSKRLSSIILPNGRGYSFEYDDGAATFGELTKITYPTGGYSRYDYGRFPADHYFVGEVIVADFREVTARHVCRDPNGACTPSTEDTTLYAPTIDGSKINNQYEDVTDPLGNRTRYEFSFSDGTGGGTFSPRELTRSIFDPSGTLIRTIQTDYNALQGGVTTNPSLPIRKTTTLNDASPALVTKVEWDYDTVADNVTAEREYDYSTATPPLLRQTIRTWLHTNSVNGADYTAIPLHILNRKLSENIQDASSNNVAQTAYEYDNYGTISASGAVQHNSAYGTTYTRRGNATKSQRWRNTDGTWLATTSTYDDAGNVLTTTAPSNSPYDSFTRTTTLSYTDAWGNASCPPTG
jgi:hypothetical protein